MSISGCLPPGSVDEEVDGEGDDIVDEYDNHDQSHEQVRHYRHDEMTIMLRGISKQRVYPQLTNGARIKRLS